ncbi:MAG: acyl carrier protein [Bacteroidetes bacterium]|nr:acyl carrier protein [Bacteroidota bacterium]
METVEVLQQLNRIFNEVLNNDSIVLTEKTTSNDVPEWDSLAYIELIVAIEKHFNIEFTASEIKDWENVGGMVSAIREKIDK